MYASQPVPPHPANETLYLIILPHQQPPLISPFFFMPAYIKLLKHQRKTWLASSLSPYIDLPNHPDKRHLSNAILRIHPIQLHQPRNQPNHLLPSISLSSTIRTLHPPRNQPINNPPQPGNQHPNASPAAQPQPAVDEQAAAGCVEGYGACEEEEGVGVECFFMSVLWCVP